MTIDITPLLHRRVVWDTIPHQHVTEVMTTLELGTGSVEGFKKEHQESHRRLAHTYPVDVLVTVLSRFAGEAVARFMLENQESLPNLDEDDKETFTESFRQMATSVVNAVLANLVEIDLLVVNEEGGFRL